MAGRSLPTTTYEFHDLFRPHTVWQWACVLLLPWFTLFPALAHHQFFFEFLAVVPLSIWVVLAIGFGVIAGTTYYPVKRFWYAGVLPGLIVGPCSLLIAEGYTARREELYRAEVAFVWLLAMAPALIIYYLSLRYLTQRTISVQTILQPAEEVEFIEDSAISDVADLLADDSTDGKQVTKPSQVTSSRMTPLAWLLSGVFSLLLFGGLAAVALYEGGSGGPATGSQPSPEDVTDSAPGTRPISAGTAIPDLRSDDTARRRTAAQNLAESPSASEGSLTADTQQELVTALTDCVDDPDLATKRSAIKALGIWGTADDAPTLIGCLGDVDALTRFEAMDALARYEDADAAEAIAERLTVGQDRQRASAALQRMGPAAEQAALSCLNNEDVWVKIEACKILAQVGTAECLGGLDAAASDAKGLVASEAKSAGSLVRARSRD